MLRPAGAGVLVASALLAGCSAVSFERADSGDEGTLTTVSLGPVTTWDPQRMTSKKDMAFAGRVFSRTLTAFPPGPDAAAQRRLVGDLATDTGTASRDLRTWSFTLRDGVTWQDGSPVTCQDVRYGVARSFAEPFASEGLNYPLAALDIPKKADGSSSYAGPYGAAEGKAAFGKAVSCKGKTITFRLTEPRGDFSQMVSLSAFAPFKEDADQREKSQYTAFSNGPYMLKGAWDPGTGGTFVRNPRWSKDSDPVREAQPERIRYQEGVEAQTGAQHIMGDEDANRRAVTLDSAPPAMQHNITGSGELRRRAVNPRLGLTDYLAVNVTSAPLAREGVRRALAVATNREGYVAALGGSTSATAAFSLVGPDIPGHLGEDALRAGTRGNPATARALLDASGLTLPVRLRVAYRSTPTADKAMAALESGWERAGFDIVLQPIAKDYFTAVSAPDRVRQSDVIWANWAADWPSASTVIPPLFDSRANLSPAGAGRNYGHVNDPRANEKMDAIAAMPDAAARDRAWAALDATLVRRGVYVALAQHRALYVAGSDVEGLAVNDALGGYVDLAAVAVR